MMDLQCSYVYICHLDLVALFSLVNYLLFLSLCGLHPLLQVHCYNFIRFSIYGVRSKIVSQNVYQAAI